MQGECPEHSKLEPDLIEDIRLALLDALTLSQRHVVSKSGASQNSEPLLSLLIGSSLFDLSDVVCSTNEPEKSLLAS